MNHSAFKIFPGYFNYAPGNRMAWVDLAKGFAIILVVYRHILIGVERSGIEVGAYSILAEITHSFRMPLFFILSGIFIRTSLLKRSNVVFIKNKLNSLIYPYLIWTVLQVSIQLLFRDYINANRTFYDYLYIFIDPRAIDQFWFIYALFNVAVIYLFFFRLFKGNKILLVIIGCIFLYSSQYIHTPVVEDILMFFIYVAIGDIFSSYLLNERNYRFFSSPTTLFCITLLFFISQWAYIQYKIHSPFFLAGIALIGCCFTFVISHTLMYNKYLTPIKIIGQHSMYIYLMHVLISAPIRILLVNLLHITEPGIIVITSTTVAVIIPIVFYNMALKHGFWFLFYPKPPKTSSLQPSRLSKV